MSFPLLLWRIAVIVFTSVLLVGCAVTIPPQNAPLDAANQPPQSPQDFGQGYRLASMVSPENSPELLIFLSFSGGGKRSAAFSYGALEGLRDTLVPGRRRLLDEIDLISAVSGGSFTAAYYGLYRDKIFDSYRKDFLYEDIEAYIWGMYFLPWHWDWMLSGSLGTNDAMAEVYDDLMFHNATYRDLANKGRPLIAVDATDITYGAPFPFVQDQFDLLCSDLSSYPVSRAVAASNGFPILFSPITLENFADRCRNNRPAWVADWLQRPELTREHEAARVAADYLDEKKTEYVHLLDGGISDNLAMRPVVSSMMRVNDDVQRYAHTQAMRARRLLLISVDGQAAADTSWARQPTVSGIGQIFAAVSGTQIDRYNFETMLLATEQMGKLVAELKDYRCQHRDAVPGEDCADVSGQVVHLSLARVTDEAQRRRLEAIPTGLTLEQADVDMLIDAGRQAVLNSPEIKAFINSLSSPAGTRPQS